MLLAMIASGKIMGAELLSGAVSNEMNEAAGLFEDDDCGNQGGGDGTGGAGGPGQVQSRSHLGLRCNSRGDELPDLEGRFFKIWPRTLRRSGLDAPHLVADGWAALLACVFGQGISPDKAHAELFHQPPEAGFSPAKTSASTAFTP